MLLIQVVSAANPPEPTYGSANMNGDPSEWDMNVGGDFFTYMYRAGKTDKPIESNASLRYDCGTQTLYVLVMTVPDVPALVSPTDAWGAIGSVSNKVVTGNSGNGSSLPAFVWVGQGYDGNNSHALGYEAAFTLAPGSYTLILHIQVDDDGAQTSATPGFPQSGIPLLIICTPNPSIDVTKMISTDNTTWIDADTPPGLEVTIGSNVYYKFVITNTGNIDLFDITLTDNLYSITPTPPMSLAPNETYTYYYGPITALSGQHTNTANATSTVDDTTYTDTDNANYFGSPEPKPAITITKQISANNCTWVDADSPPGITVKQYQKIYYKIIITNTGDTELFNLTLTDTLYDLSGVSLPNSLAPNASFVTYIGPICAIAGQHTNIATATGDYNNTTYEDSDPANYYTITKPCPSISVVKSVSCDNTTWVDANCPPGLIVDAGSDVYFKFEITNTGNVGLSSIKLVDSAFYLNNGLPSSLEPGETYTYYYGPVQAQSCQHTDYAVVSGKYHYKTYYDGDRAYYYGTPQQTEYCTYTASDYSGCGKPAQILKDNFKNCFYNGLEIGEYRFWGFWGGNGYKWTSVTSLQQFLECNGYNSAIYRSRYNPTNLRWGGGTLAVQTATLSINVAFSEKAVDNIPTGFGDLHFVLLGNSLSGKTVSEILEMANDALAGKGLPYGYSYNSLNELITQLNCAFKNGVPSSWGNTYLQA